MMPMVLPRSSMVWGAGVLLADSAVRSQSSASLGEQHFPARSILTIEYQAYSKRLLPPTMRLRAAGRRRPSATSPQPHSSVDPVNVVRQSQTLPKTILFSYLRRLSTRHLSRRVNFNGSGGRRADVAGQCNTPWPCAGWTSCAAMTQADPSAELGGETDGARHCAVI